MNGYVEVWEVGIFEASPRVFYPEQALIGTPCESSWSIYNSPAMILILILRPRDLALDLTGIFSFDCRVSCALPYIDPPQIG